MRKTLASIAQDWSLFLDRDGVINVRPVGDYVKSPEDFVFLPGVPEAIAQFNKLFARTVVVTNQQGIAKGLMTEKALEEVHAHMHKQLALHHARIEAVYFCPFLASANNPYRKPGVGMGLAARKQFPTIEFGKSVMVGDSISDMQFGKRLGMLTVFIADTPKEARKYPKLIDYTFSSLKALAGALEGVH